MSSVMFSERNWCYSAADRKEVITAGLIMTASTFGNVARIRVTNSRSRTSPLLSLNIHRDEIDNVITALQRLKQELTEQSNATPV